MSGGRFGYAGAKIRDALDTIADDPDVRKRFPDLANALTGRPGESGLAGALYDLEHAIDWDLSSDSFIPDDAVFQHAALWALLKPLLIAAPDAWFPRGKWATIQAVDGRRYPEPTPMGRQAITWDDARRISADGP